jgi:hypothetical protein
MASANDIRAARRLRFPHRQRVLYSCSMSDNAPRAGGGEEPPKRSPEEMKRWREEFFLSLRDVSPERRAKIAGMIRTRPAGRVDSGDQPPS